MSAPRPLTWLQAALADISATDSLDQLRALCLQAFGQLYGCEGVSLYGVSSSQEQLVPLGHSQGDPLPTIAWTAESLIGRSLSASPEALPLSANSFELPEGLARGKPVWVFGAKHPKSLFASLVLVLAQTQQGTPDHHRLAQIYLAQVVATTARMIKLQDLEQGSKLLQQSRAHSVKQQDRLAQALPRSLEQTIVGHSPQIEAVRQTIIKFAPSDQSVLIQGETGTGKELVARSLHALSHLASKPFVSENIAAISPSLMESELFGHVKGAFTGADQDRKGLFERAHMGTLFLDEIGDLPMELQVRLLRVLQEKEIRPVGGTQPRKVDFRLITATHKNLGEMAVAESFRTDLLFRLKQLPIVVPPLRERTGDIEVLIDHFKTACERKSKLAYPQVSEQALGLLQDHPYPGNVRELEMLVERMALEGTAVSAEALMVMLQRTKQKVGLMMPCQALGLIKQDRI